MHCHTEDPVGNVYVAWTKIHRAKSAATQDQTKTHSFVARRVTAIVTFCNDVAYSCHEQAERVDNKEMLSPGSTPHLDRARDTQCRAVLRHLPDGDTIYNMQLSFVMSLTEDNKQRQCDSITQALFLFS